MRSGEVEIPPKLICKLCATVMTILRLRILLGENTRTSKKKTFGKNTKTKRGAPPRRGEVKVGLVHKKQAQAWRKLGAGNAESSRAQAGWRQPKMLTCG